MVIDRQLSSSSLSLLLPEDIIVQIVGRISCIKTILRCTCVCKSWYSFITSTQFVKFHDDNKINIDKPLLICEYYFGRGKAYCFSIHDDSENFHKYYSDTLKLVRQGHASNGLICYTRYDEDPPYSLYLWNPVIRKVKKLPDIDDDSGHHDIHKYPVFKLWFDSNANDYKILSRSITNKTATNTFCSVHVYSLNTNSWKLIITQDADLVSTYQIGKLVYVSGTWYWPSLKDEDKWTLVSLDTKSWMFRETPTKFQARYLVLESSNHDDSLVILSYPIIDDAEDSNFGVCDVYKYTTNEIYSVNIGEDGRIDVDVGQFIDEILFRLPLGVRHNYELLFHDHISLRIFSYNTKTEMLTEFDSTAIDDHNSIGQVTPFVENLALLDHTDAYGI